VATTQLAATNGCVANLNYNTTTLTALSVTVDNTLGDQAVTFYINAGLFSRSITQQPGVSSDIVFPSALSIVLGGAPGQLTMIGLTSFGIGTGAGVGT
jgi:hypothetical protein